MKQIAQYQDGRLELQEVPIPSVPPGGILVRVTHSVISTGTEKMKVEQANMSLVQKARARPDQVRKVLDTAATLGWRSALDKVRNRLETPTPLGYSACGVVEAVDRLTTNFRVGDRVAVGGAECAFHAEFVAVPGLLAAKVPAGVDNWEAAYTTVISIALQAVRRLEPSLGDRVLVLGQGLVGLLVTALLRANGVRVMAADLNPNRSSQAAAMGAERTVALGQQDLLVDVDSWTEGYGVDAVVLCASTESNTALEQSAAVLRDRGRIVVVGNAKADLSWKVFFEKELEVRYSRSYGPGRYDPSYEWGGTDYPFGYVRWTEQRNFEAALHLLATKQLDVTAITTRRVPLSEALTAYEAIVSGREEVGIVLEYATVRAPSDPARDRSRHTASGSGPTRVKDPVRRLDVIGAGNFARTMLLPHLRGHLEFGTVVNQTPLSAQHVKTKFGFAAASTDAAVVLEPTPGHDSAGAASAVLIATRHHLHGAGVAAALAGDRHVFVEKPLCLSRAELDAIDGAIDVSRGSVQVGFNRRFAEASTRLKELLRSTPGPKTASYRVVPGKLSSGSWYANYAESGGRVLGEGCHFFDYFCFLFDVPPVRVTAQATWPVGGRLPFADSFAAQVEFADGSCGQLVYSAEGDPTWPKEQCTVYAAGLVAELVNFQRLTVRRGRRKTESRFRGKGHAEQMQAWLSFLRGERAHPFPYPAARESMLLTFAAVESIAERRTVDV